MIREEKLPLAVRCCHVANDLTNFTYDRQTDEQTNKKTNGGTLPSRKSTAFESGELISGVQRQEISSHAPMQVLPPGELSGNDLGAVSGQF